MKIEAQQITSVRLTEVEALDPITVTLQNFEPGKGTIGIECWGKAWTAYWGGMSGDPVEEFFCRCNASYLIGNLDPGLRSSITDLDKIQDWAKADIIQRRRDGDLDELDAREYFDTAEFWLNSPDSIDAVAHHLSEIMGEDWWYDLPETTNPDYAYLERIVIAVQEGLQEFISSQVAAA